MDNTTLTFLAALGGAFLVVIGAIVLATFLNRGAATREFALLSALESERKARAEIEQQRELERVESRKYREETSARMASMERELTAVKAELAIVKQRGEIERATLMNLLRLKQDLRIRKRENLRVCRFASVFECWFGGYGMLLSGLRYPELQRWGRLRLNAQTGNGRAICPDDSGARGPTAAALCHL